MAISRLGKKGTREPFRRKRIVLPAICRDIFNAARTELCLNFSAQSDRQRVESSQSNSGAMATDQRSRLMEDCRRHLNRLHAPNKSVERLFSWWKSAGRIRVMERKSGLAFHRGEFTGAGIARAQNGQCLHPTLVAQCHRDKHGRVDVQQGHQSSSRSCKMARTAREESTPRGVSFNSEIGRGFGPGRTSPAATSRSCGSVGIAVILATSRLFLVIDIGRPVRWTVAMISGGPVLQLLDADRDADRLLFVATT